MFVKKNIRAFVTANQLKITTSHFQKKYNDATNVIRYSIILFNEINSPINCNSF